MVWRFLKKDGNLCEADTILESLGDAETPQVCWVEGSTISKGLDATKALHEFAIWCVETVGLGSAPENLGAIQVKKLWLEGKATKDVLTEARSVARRIVFIACGTCAISTAFLTARSIYIKRHGLTKSDMNEELERRLNLLEQNPTKALERTSVKTRWERISE